MTASDPILPAPCPSRPRPARLLAGTYENMTREELVGRLLIVEDQNHLLRLLHQISMNLLAVLREGGAAEGLWERRVLEVRSNGISGAEEEEEDEGDEEDEEKDEEDEEDEKEDEENKKEENEEDVEQEEVDGNRGNRAHRIKQQLLQALRKELKPWPSTALIVVFFIFSKVIDFLIGLLTNYVFGQIMKK